MKWQYKETRTTKALNLVSSLGNRLDWPMWIIKLHARIHRRIDYPWYDGKKWTQRIKAH